MKTIVLIVIIILGTSAWAQELPRKSPKAKVEQVVGLNGISIEYSRPGVKGREIFGDLVPYGEVWRLGADSPTKIHLEHPIFVGEQKLDSGTYAIFAIPTEENWTVVFNTDYKQWGAFDYDSAKNVISYEAPVSESDFTETFGIFFENVKESGADIVFEWASVRVTVPFSTETDKLVKENIDAAIANGEKLDAVYYKAADYYFNKGEKKLAEEMLEKSLAVAERYFNLFLKASIMKESDRDAALKIADQASRKAEEEGKSGWADYIRGEMAGW